MLLEGFPEEREQNLTPLWIFLLLVTVFGGYAVTDMFLFLFDLQSKDFELYRRLIYHTFLMISAIILSIFNRDGIKNSLALRKFRNYKWILPIIGSALFSFSLASGQKCEVVANDPSILEKLAVTVFPAISEELIFRGWFLYAVYFDLGKVFSVILTSTIFAALHYSGNNIIGLFLIFCFSLLWCKVRLSSKTIFPTIICHILQNCFNVLSKGVHPFLCELPTIISFCCWILGAVFCVLFELTEDDDE